ncbi:LuxR C-terminal-related transcriptional regulator [Actinoplanes sp. NPDC089786]|uniref:LuxR C-terminal-related transcriptional regulator n=1 Tax=Actinoplanes sp. NPDC089786 TaxID=3155185 RepID=UPI0034252AA2
MVRQENGDLVRDVESYLRQLTAVAESAGNASEAAAIAAAFAEAQRVAAWGLRSAVELGRDRGLSWRQLADLIDIPVSTLHRQYRSGTAILSAAESRPSFTEAPPGTCQVPPVFDSFVGRERELAALSDLLRRSRQVSVVGPVGVGKTRFAAELARRGEPSYPGGVRWVELAPVTKPWQVALAVGRAGEPNGTEAALLVLDNCEHVLDSLSEVVPKLLAHAPNLNILTTSREALGLQGETVMLLEPLRAEAVRLFGARASAARPDFDPDAWADVIAEICDRLDGLPLAIELAAHQMDVLTPESLLSMMAQRLDLLVGAQRSAIGRRRSLRNAIRWSYELLDETERQVYARLSLLPGGFDQRSAAAVTADLGLSRAQLWALLAGLARKSMIVTDAQCPVRFRMLESLRAFGREVLTDVGDLIPTQILLLEWLAAVGQQLSQHSWSAERTMIEQHIVAETENLRYGVNVAAAMSHPSHPDLAILLARLLANTSDLDEVGRLLSDVVSNSGTPALHRANALAWLARNDTRQGDLEAAVHHSNQAYELARELDDVDTLAIALTSVMMTRGSTGDLPGGLRIGHELTEMLLREDRTDLAGWVLSKQAWLLVANGDPAAAREAITESMRMYESQADWALPYANDSGLSLLHTAAVAATLEHDDAAAAEYITAVLTMPVPRRDIVLSAIECAAILAMRRKKHTLALTLIAGTAAVGRPVQAFWTRQLQETTRAAEQAIGPAAAQAASAAGPLMTIPQLTDLALSGGLPIDEDPTGTLTRRELAVAVQVAQGLTNAQIAKGLFISVRTVASHLANIRSRLNVRSRVEVALWVSRMKIETAAGRQLSQIRRR